MADDRPYLSVGEVLELLRAEFPDLSIARVREFESEGQLRPERTASGYRKFYDDDIAVLRTLLRMPQSDATEEVETIPVDDAAVAESERRHPASYRTIRRRPRPEDLHVGANAVRHGGSAPTAEHDLIPNASADQRGGDQRGGDQRGKESRAARLAVVREPVVAQAPAAALPPSPVAVSSEAAPAAGEALLRGSQNPLLAAGTAVSLSLAELATAAGAEPALIRELEQYGLVCGRAVFGSTTYDEDALLVTRAAAAFARHGVEPRHLRLYRSLAERELAFFEQVLSPQIHHRSGDSRQKAGELLGDLVRLGEQLRTATVRVAARASIEQYRSGG